MLELKTPRGLDVSVPECAEEDTTPGFQPHELEAIRAFYREHGYVVVRKAFSHRRCDRLRELWDQEVKPYGGFIYRQATAKVEKHFCNAQGWIMNPILNPQSLDPRHFPLFRAYAANEILSDATLTSAFANLLGDRPKIVQSIYFEGNSATWEHQDSYYLDSETSGEMAAAWIALEDITARAGRFFICPDSHRIALQAHAMHNNIATHHERYITSVVAEIRQAGLEIRAPLLDKGDVLFWNAWTIHGSLDTQDAACSRSSLNCHAIPYAKSLLQMQSRKRKMRGEQVNGTTICRPKDLARLRNRLVFGVETHFPQAFYWLKRRAILHVLKHKSA
jgi:phytanoyl-CoA hydroxylase